MEPDRVTLLLGNHMLHYVGLSNDRCRLDWNNRIEIYNILKENQPLFLNAFRWGNTLFTHAGVTKGWLEQCGCEEDPETIINVLNNKIEFSNGYLTSPSVLGLGDSLHPIGDIGRSRGGYAPYGSPAWADISEMLHGSAFKDSLTQIFGHSQLQETGTFIHRDNWYCCDSRAVFIWDGKNLKTY